MSQVRPFTGVVEALPPEEWAVRLRISVDHFRKRYKGPVKRIGAVVRIYSYDVHEWLESFGGASITADPWAGVGSDDAEESSLPARKQSEMVR
jgi:hypothetical protein